MMTRRQRQALIAAEKAIQEHYRRFSFMVAQGSWRPPTGYSGTTHTGAGVVDLQYPDIANTTRAGKEKYGLVLRHLRGVGCQAAFGRGPWSGMSFHFHVCDLDTHGMNSNAVWQVGEYREGDDGLYDDQPDPFPWRPDPIRKWQFRG